MLRGLLKVDPYLYILLDLYILLELLQFNNLVELSLYILLELLQFNNLVELLFLAGTTSCLRSFPANVLSLKFLNLISWRIGPIVSVKDVYIMSETEEGSPTIVQVSMHFRICI